MNYATICAGEDIVRQCTTLPLRKDFLDHLNHAHTALSQLRIINRTAASTIEGYDSEEEVRAAAAELLRQLGMLVLGKANDLDALLCPVKAVAEPAPVQYPSGAALKLMLEDTHFTSKLADLYAITDLSNRERLATAFADVFARYEARAKTA